MLLLCIVSASSTPRLSFRRSAISRKRSNKLASYCGFLVVRSRWIPEFILRRRVPGLPLLPSFLLHLLLQARLMEAVSLDIKEGHFYTILMERNFILCRNPLHLIHYFQSSGVVKAWRERAYGLEVYEPHPGTWFSPWFSQPQQLPPVHSIDPQHHH